MKQRIEKLETMLRGKPRTAKQVADGLGITKPWAYTLIRRLAKSLPVFQVEKTSQGKTGPNPTAWMIK